jgi:phospholipase/carboxylesterase
MNHTDLTLQYIESVPSGKTGELPIVVLIHGRGADANDLADLAHSLDDGYRFIFPNAPAPFEIMRGYSQGFTWFDGWPPVEGSIEKSRDLLLTFLGEISERYATPFTKMVLGGFSQGGMMSIDAGFRVDPQLAGIVVLSGGTYEKGLADLSTKKEMAVFLAHGMSDDVIPPFAAQRTRAILEQAGLRPEYHEYDMGHWIVPEELAAVRDFIKRALA